MPKDPAIRQRRNKSASRAMLPSHAGPLEKAPRLPNNPKGWEPMTRRVWKQYWESPMHYEFVVGDLPAMFRLIFLWDRFFKKGSLEVAKEIRLLEREFGLTPLSRRRLEWQVVQAEEAVDRHEHRRARRAVILDAGDPREVLE